MAAIGAVAVAPSDPKVVWVGTGEANDRNSSSWGNGVYRSTDAGGDLDATSGLKESKTIARIVVHPTDPDDGLGGRDGRPVAARRRARALQDDRRRRDLEGRAHGARALRATGSAAARWPSIPRTPTSLYAALYARRRTPWSFASGPERHRRQGPGRDLQERGRRRHLAQARARGCPARTGRIGLDVSRKNPRIVYAIVQSDEGGTERHRRRAQPARAASSAPRTRGESWTRTSPLNPRPFYFSQIRVDPENDQRVYVLGFALHVSEDGGTHVPRGPLREGPPRQPRPGHRPAQPQAPAPGHGRRRLPELQRRARPGSTSTGWRPASSTGSASTTSTPYRICGGLQDNLNWVGPSRTRTKDGIVNSRLDQHRRRRRVLLRRSTPRTRTSSTPSRRQGYVHRIDLRERRRSKDLRPEPPEGQAGLPLPLELAAHRQPPRQGRAVPGRQPRVPADRARASSGQVISPDLSARDPDKIDGGGQRGRELRRRLHARGVAAEGGPALGGHRRRQALGHARTTAAHWTDLTASLPAAVKGQWISRIEAGAPRRRRSPTWPWTRTAAGNYAPLAYRTGDGGKTWQAIAGDLPADGPVKVVREDPAEPDAALRGHRVRRSSPAWTAARHWTKLGGLPTVAVDDIVVHPRDRDLVIATHGRSLYVLDDMRPLQELTPEVLAKDAHLFPPRPAAGLPPAARLGGLGRQRPSSAARTRRRARCSPTG